jgi:hypothetical protein
MHIASQSSDNPDAGCEPGGGDPDLTSVSVDEADDVTINHLFRKASAN